MKQTTKIFSLLGAVTIAIATWVLITEKASSLDPAPRDNMTRYSAGDLEVGIRTEPATPRVGDNRLFVEILEAGAETPASVTVEAYAEMPAMGAMQAMRAPAELEEVGPGRYEGSVNLMMRGEWPLTMTIQQPGKAPRRLQFDLATDRAGLPISAGGTALGGSVQTTTADEDAASVITIDNRRRQMIGLQTGVATHRDLTKSIRAVGEVTYDERLLSQVVLKYDGYVGELHADFAGAAIEKGQVLFTVYSPDLLAAQQEYLEVLRRRPGSPGSLAAAAKQRLRLWDLAPADIASLEQGGVAKDYVAIRAPRNGTLIERHIADGSSIRRGQNLLSIADLSRVWIEAEVFEADLDLVSSGMNATINLPYLPGRKFPATVEFVYPYLDETTRTGRVRLSLDNSAGLLKPGMYAEVSLQADLGHRLSVPEEAILVAGKSRVVFVDLGSGRLKPVRIQTGRSAEGFVEVLDGLQLGDTVVTSGNFLVAAEARLKTGLNQW